VPSPDPAAVPGPAPSDRLLRIREVADETGLTTRAIRYYEQLGLLRPVARSDGDYRLYDASDLERLRSIRRLRDDAGFSLAEIGLLLEDESLRRADTERFRASVDPTERRAIAEASLARVERRLALLRGKAARIAEMVADAEARERHIREHLAELPTEGSR
jgi:DNA-binding transcriptional MerR regulator